METAINLQVEDNKRRWCLGFENKEIQILERIIRRERNTFDMVFTEYMQREESASVGSFCLEEEGTEHVGNFHVFGPWDA